MSGALSVKSDRVVDWGGILRITPGSVSAVDKLISQFLNIPVGRNVKGESNWHQDVHSHRNGMEVVDFSNYRTLRAVNKSLKKAIGEIITFYDIKRAYVLTHLPLEIMQLCGTPPVDPEISDTTRLKKTCADGFRNFMQLPHVFSATTPTGLTARNIAVLRSLETHGIKQWIFVEHGTSSDTKGISLVIVRDLPWINSNRKIIERFEFQHKKETSRICTHQKPFDKTAAPHVLACTLDQTIGILNYHGLSGSSLIAQIDHEHADHIQYDPQQDSELPDWALFIIGILSLIFCLPCMCFYWFSENDKKEETDYSEPLV